MDLGLTISDIEFLAYDTVGDPLDFSYFITGGTFSSTETEAKPFCYLKDPGILDSNIITGTPDPDSFVMIKDLPISELIFCEILTTGLNPGYYQVFAGAEYDFEVWSYIPYTFVSQSTFEAYGKNINTQLNIEENTHSTNTNGPMVLTISELAQKIPQPYIIRDDRDSNFLVNFKLENKDKGKLRSLDYVILQVPKEFDANCFREAGKWEQRSDKGKAILSAQIITSELKKGNIDPDISFLDDMNIILLEGFTKKEIENPQINFRCSLKLGKDKKFLSPGTQTKKTIVATAKYTYQVEQVAPIQLKDPVIV